MLGAFTASAVAASLDRAFATILNQCASILTLLITWEVGMRWAWTLAGVAIVAISPNSRADDRSDCLEGADTELRIKGCSAVIDANPNDAPAYYTRGIAYQSRGEIDRAIADYSSAIELNPYHASAYEARARADAGNGDYVHAVADVTKAGELMSASGSPSAAPPM